MFNLNVRYIKGVKKLKTAKKIDFCSPNMYEKI